MSVIAIQPGTIDVTVELSIIDSGDGTPETGVTSATAGLDLEYHRQGAAGVDLTESDLSALTDAHADGGMLHRKGGRYRVDLPDAACAIGADYCEVLGTITGMIVLPLRIDLREPGRVHAGIAQGGTAQSAILASAADGTNDNRYKGHFARIVHAGPYAAPGLAIDTVPEDFKITNTFAFRVNGLTYSKAAATGISFSAADTINTGAAAGIFYGGWLVQVDTAGTVSTKSPSGDQTYASAGLALTAAQALVPDANNIRVGTIVIGANTGAAWRANTDDMTPASDCSSASFADASLTAGVQELADITSYTASSRTAALTQTLVFAVDKGDEVYVYLGAYGSSLQDISDELAGDTAFLNAVADGILNRDMSTGTDSGSTTVRTPRQALRALRNKVSVSGGTVTVTKEDDSTASWTGAVTGTPSVTAIDPAGP